MKKYEYKGELYTMTELHRHPDCIVASHELKRNIWKKHLPIAEAMVAPIKITRAKAKSTYYYQGLDMTIAELSELPECKVCYYILNKNLKAGATIGEALANIKPINRSSRTGAIKKKIKPQYKNGVNKAQGGSISFSKPTTREDMSYTYLWLVLDKWGFEMDKKGVNLQKTIDKIID